MMESLQPQRLTANKFQLLKATQFVISYYGHGTPPDMPRVTVMAEDVPSWNPARQSLTKNQCRNTHFPLVP